MPPVKFQLTDLAQLHLDADFIVAMHRSKVLREHGQANNGVRVPHALINPNQHSTLAVWQNAVQNPVWVPDNASNSCMLCDGSFGILPRCGEQSKFALLVCFLF